VFDSVLKIPNAVKRLASASGIICWIQGAVKDVPPAPSSDTADCPLSKAILSLLTTFWTSAKLVIY
jgi:hypothetical protein